MLYNAPRQERRITFSEALTIVFDSGAADNFSLLVVFYTKKVKSLRHSSPSYTGLNKHVNANMPSLFVNVLGLKVDARVLWVEHEETEEQLFSLLVRPRPVIRDMKLEAFDFVGLVPFWNETNPVGKLLNEVTQLGDLPAHLNTRTLARGHAPRVEILVNV